MKVQIAIFMMNGRKQKTNFLKNWFSWSLFEKKKTGDDFLLFATTKHSHFHWETPELFSTHAESKKRRQIQSKTGNSLAQVWKHFKISQRKASNGSYLALKKINKLKIQFPPWRNNRASVLKTKYFRAISSGGIGTIWKLTKHFQTGSSMRFARKPLEAIKTKLNKFN